MTDDHDAHPDTNSRVDRRTLTLLIAATLAIRIAVLAAIPDTFVADPDAYRAVAINLVEHGCFGYGDQPIATRPLLYPLVLAACKVIDPALWYSLALVHLILGVATVVLTYHLAIRWRVGRLSWLAAALVAIDPLLLLHSTLVMTETLATFLAVAGLLAVTRCAERPVAIRAILAGILMGLAVLCKPTFLPWTAVTILLLPFAADTWQNRAKLFFATVASMVVVLSPWAVRNAVHFGKPTPATNHGGFTLLLANNPSFYDYLRAGQFGEVWNADQFNQDWKIRAQKLATGDEVAADRLAYADALTVIQDQPATFAYACLVRVCRIWGLVPHRTSPNEGIARCTARWAIGAFYTIEFLLAAIGLVALARGRVPRNHLLRGWVWGLLLAASFTAIHTFYWTNIRMRAPLIPVVSLAAALGTAQIAAMRIVRKSMTNKDLRHS
jgi:4-amino-4-deoxy-L-arabinose transferase-like glycosyltransferase